MSDNQEITIDYMTTIFDPSSPNGLLPPGGFLGDVGAPWELVNVSSTFCQRKAKVVAIAAWRRTLTLRPTPFASVFADDNSPEVCGAQVLTNYGLSTCCLPKHGPEVMHNTHAEVLQSKRCPQYFDNTRCRLQPGHAGPCDVVKP